jgi:hypothetical protein
MPNLDGLGDVFERLSASEDGLQRNFPVYRVINHLADTDAAEGGFAFKTRRDIDAITRDTAGFLAKYVPDVDAHAVFQRLLGRKCFSTLAKLVLKLYGAGHGIVGTPETEQQAVTHGIEHLAMVFFTAFSQGFKIGGHPFDRASFVPLHAGGIADHVSKNDGG